jgi:hypothetical protein
MPLYGWVRVQFKFLFMRRSDCVSKVDSEDTAPYVFGGTLARAIVIFTAPLVAVIVPPGAKDCSIALCGKQENMSQVECC